MGISIGVTGHRILTEIEKIERGIVKALAHIEQSHPEQTLTVLSSLAEGTDRLVARCVLTRANARLVVPLPMPQAEYEADFTTVESKAEFLELLNHAVEIIELPPVPTREGAYEAAGRYVLDHCDVLLAVWDGQPEQGMGGTGGIVNAARKRELPLVWVHAGNRKPGTMESTTLGSEQGEVSFENL
jgi:hypothetical protein